MSQTKADPTLTARQAQFCKEYIVDLNASKAAIRAGYAEKHADCTSSRLVGKSQVAKEIARLQKASMKRVEISADDALKHLQRSLKYNGQLKETEAGETIMDATAYNKAIDLAMRHNAMLTDKKLIEGTVKLTGFDVLGE